MLSHSEECENIPRPPGLHWTLVLLLTVFTAGLFVDVWMIVQALWARKINPESSALALYFAGIAASVMGALLNGHPQIKGVGGILLLAAIVLITVASFSVRDSLGQYITSVTGKPTYLSGVMTILFGPIYLQYHMNKVRSFERHHSVAAGH